MKTLGLPFAVEPKSKPSSLKPTPQELLLVLRRNSSLSQRTAHPGGDGSLGRLKREETVVILYYTLKPVGMLSLSAKTVNLSATPSPSVSSQMTMRSLPWPAARRLLG